MSNITLKISWLVLLGMLIAGAILPMFTFTKFYFFDDTFSLLLGIFHLLSQDQYALFVLIFSFSILLPLYKMFILFLILFNIMKAPEKKQRLLQQVSLLGKWSMLDVFVVAILVVTIKLGILLEVKTHAGIFVFAIAVLGSMFLTHKITKLNHC